MYSKTANALTSLGCDDIQTACISFTNLRATTTKNVLMLPKLKEINEEEVFQG